VLDAFCQRLQKFRGDHDQGSESSREQEIQIQAEWACSLARENDFLIQPNFTWQSLRDAKDCFVGSEHFVDSNPEIGRVAKITIPSAFGLLPGIVNVSQGFGKIRQMIEAVDATPIEYLRRWIANNDVFQDDVHLESVIQWPDGAVSFAISQPQYHGEPANERQIDRFFEAAGWTRLAPKFGHKLYYNYAFEVLAMDMESRNCYSTKNGLQPFDVILTHPDDELEQFLGLF